MRLKIKSSLMTVIAGLIFLAAGLAVTGCDDKTPPPEASSTATGFTFLNMGADTVLSRSVRDNLGNSLGTAAVSYQTPIDLEINYPGFIETYFPPIFKRNRQLNDAANARREHDTIKLMYRYPQEKSRVFKKVTLLFSGQSRKPLFFKIVAGKEGADIIDTMQKKYGAPKKIKWSHEPGTSYLWRKDNDFLVVSKVRDRFGDPEYRIAIYYGSNIDELIDAERRKIQENEEKRKKAGRTAF